jgi:hypothetical protein
LTDLRGSGDGDDHDPNVHPRNDEVCTNGIDDDCDGRTDRDDGECSSN